MSVHLFVGLVNPSVRLPLSCDGQGTDSITSWFVGSQGCDSPSLLRSIWKWTLVVATAKAEKDEVGLMMAGGVFLEVHQWMFPPLPMRLDATSPEGGY